jgi:Flp pilus assembly protein CpaB
MDARDIWFRHRWRLAGLRFWFPVLVIGLLVALIVQRSLAAGAEARRDWGETRAVVVAVTPLMAGDAISGDAVAVVERPRAMVPDGALDALPADAVVAVDVPAGEPLLATRLVGGAASDIGARTAIDRRAMAVPVDPGSLVVAIGDRVDLLAASPIGDLGQLAGEVVAAAAPVVDVTDTHVVVAVRSAEAPAMAVALADGYVSVAVRSAAQT